MPTIRIEAGAASGVQVVRDAPRTGRVLRKPRHTFKVQTVPFAITPFLIAPVLPGETLDHGLLQAKAELPPVKAKDGGWWYETYIFYVKHRDLALRDEIVQMHMDPTNSTPAALVTVPENQATMFAGNGVDWVKLCLERVTEEFFRDEGEGVWDADKVIDNGDGKVLPLASIDDRNWLQSAIPDALSGDGDDSALPGEEHPGEVIGATGHTVPAGFENAYQAWLDMRALSLTVATFEDYLKSFGVKPPEELKEELHVPELLRYLRDWVYPQVAVYNYLDEEDNPLSKTGFAPRWAISERLDKDRYFAEPGFIFGVTVMRPKVYYTGQAGAAVQALDNAYSWLPAVLSSEPYTSLRKFAAGTGPLPNQTAAYWVDLKDLFVHGDQFISAFRSYGDLMAGNGFYLAGETLDRRYADENMIAGLFDDAVAEYAQAGLVDGVMELSIKSSIVDTTP